MYAPLFSCPLLSSKLDSPVIKILERHSLKLKKFALEDSTWRPGIYFSTIMCLGALFNRESDVISSTDEKVRDETLCGRPQTPAT